MPDRHLIARLFLLGGGVVALLGLIFWWLLPIAEPYPPYLLTALLTLGYGAWLWRGVRRPPSNPQ